MAKKEKAKIDLGADFNVKLADGKGSKVKPDQLDIESPTIALDPATPKVKSPLVDKCIEMSRQIENLETELKIHEATIIESALKAKTSAADDDDKFVKTVNVKGSELKMQIQFKDAFSKMDISMQDPLKKIFTDKYEMMFSKIEVHTLREEKLLELKTLLGDKFEIYFTTDVSLKPAENFQQTFFNLRKSFKDDQVAVIEKVKAATQSKPAVKYPK